ncbi:hypothetical protein HDU76_004162 [Blyttiomyces sp. JEL0837]|nr:hypothetical protein HDU76_004162 [Blyttiomyces sp. JEL0837]
MALVLRGPKSPVPLNRSFMKDHVNGRGLLLVGSLVRPGAAIVGCFHCGQGSFANRWIMDTLYPRDLISKREDSQSNLVAFRFFSSGRFGFVSDDQASFLVDLAPRDAEIVSFITPIECVSVPGVFVTCLGLIKKYNGLMAVKSFVEIESTLSETRVDADAKEIQFVQAEIELKSSVGFLMRLPSSLGFVTVNGVVDGMAVEVSYLSQGDSTYYFEVEITDEDAPSIVELTMFLK